MRITLLLALLFSLLLSRENFAQSDLDKYWVFFTDKEQGSFDPHTYFDRKAIERRIKSGIPLNHSTDWPVKEHYIDLVSKIATESFHKSRWFNALSIKATAEEAREIRLLNFVKSVEVMVSLSYPAAILKSPKSTYDTELTEYQMELLKEQTLRMEGDIFHENNIRGEGIRIAIFDAGFPSVDINPAFEHIRKANRIIKTRDFLTGKDNVYKHSSHGCNVLSCIAGIINGQKIGLATEAEFLLARTESGVFEPFSEEENWLAAVEWADKNGADIINSSLGYTEKRYFTSDMDGKTSLVARAANMAARKGLLVLNAAGNDGDGNWKYQGTPADADSVLSVGGISFDTDYHIDFSSYGPTSDKRMKPNICTFGVAMVAGPGGIKKAFGTSFASPLAAGFAACAWQSSRESTNMEMFKKLEEAGDLHPYFDYAHGFGVPRASYFIDPKENPKTPTFEIINSGQAIEVVIDRNQFDLDGEDEGSLLYYHVENTAGYLDKYYVIAARQYVILYFNEAEFAIGSTLRVHYKGYTTSHTF